MLAASAANSHAVHFHLVNVQLINRVGWDGAIKPPAENELGWKDTVIMNPLEDCIVAMRAISQVLPFKLPNSLRPFDVTSPLGSTAGFTNVNPSNNTPITVRNLKVNFGAEYVWHCHLLGHEEHDMMRPLIFAIAPEAPTGLVASNITGPRRVRLDWTDNSLNATRFMIQRATNAGFSSNLRTFYTAGTENTYRDATVQGNTTYYFRVYAQNIVGGVAPGNPSMTVTSLVSNVVSIRTLVAPDAQPQNPNDPAPLPSVDE